ncbi:MAG: hypothetical protein CML30_09165 [Rhizobiales bacterium]|nr:hypothetical protein [Hyphomicrobiales bacterium]
MTHEADAARASMRRRYWHKKKLVSIWLLFSLGSLFPALYAVVAEQSMASASSYSIMTASREADGWWLFLFLVALLAVVVISVACAWAFAGHNGPVEEIRDSLIAVRAMRDEGATPDD